MMNIRKLVELGPLALFSLALAGCGDGSGGGIASTPTPPSYQTLQQIVSQGGNRSFSTSGVQLGATTATSNPYGSGVTVAYTASSDSYTLTAPDGTAATFSPNNLYQAATTPNTVQYIKSSGSGSGEVDDNLVIGTATVKGVALSYTMVGEWVHATPNGIAIWLATGGVPTLASDVPKTGTANYTVEVNGSAQAGGTSYSIQPTNSSGTFSANFGAGTVATSLTLVGTPSVAGFGTVTQFGTFNGTGTITAGGPGFTGTFSTGSGSSLFTGNFNGPQAAEVGYSWAINTGSLAAAGITVGKKN